MILGLLSVVGVAAAPSASAGYCYTDYHWTTTGGGGSDVVTIPWGGVCQDFQASYTQEVGDYIKGEYLVGGEWPDGSVGEVYVSSHDTGWDIFITNILNGSSVRGNSRYHNQNVRYVY